MEIDNKTLLVIVLIAITIYSAWRAHVTLAEKVHDLDQRLKKMEDARRLRMPYAAYDSILDALAGLDVEERESQFHSNIRENIRAHLFKAIQTGTKRDQDQ